MRFEYDHYPRLWSMVSRRGRSGFARVWKVRQVKDSSRFKQHVRCCDRRALIFEMALLEVFKYDFCFGSIEIPGKRAITFQLNRDSRHAFPFNGG